MRETIVEQAVKTYFNKHNVPTGLKRFLKSSMFPQNSVRLGNRTYRPVDHNGYFSKIDAYGVRERNPYLRTAILPNFCLRIVLPSALVNLAVNL